MTMENEVQKEEVEAVEEQTDSGVAGENPGETPGETSVAEDNPGDNPGGSIAVAVLSLTALALGSVGAYFLRKKKEQTATQAQAEARARADREAKLRQFRQTTDTGGSSSGDGLI